MISALPFDALMQNALSLSLEDRSRMASRLIDSLDEDVPISPAWQKELESRVEAVRNGSLRTIPHEEVMDEARAVLAGIRDQKRTA